MCPGIVVAPMVSQLFDAMLGPGQMVAVEDLDAIAWQQRRVPPFMVVMTGDRRSAVRRHYAAPTAARCA